jgi:N-acetylmuramoyl-L-alanine amidase
MLRSTPVNILGPSQVGVLRARRWAQANRAAPFFPGLAALYWRLAPGRGVRPEVAYAQFAKESGFGRFGGVLDASYHNPCGLKHPRGGGNFDPDAHQRFATWAQGITAHIDHLALYAGALGYPRVDTPDPRHFGELLGKAKSVEALSGKWAPAADYGKSIASMVRAIAKA